MSAQDARPSIRDAHAPTERRWVERALAGLLHGTRVAWSRCALPHPELACNWGGPTGQQRALWTPDLGGTRISGEGDD